MQHSHIRPKKIGPQIKAGTSDTVSTGLGSVQRMYAKTATPMMPAMKCDGRIPSRASLEYECLCMRTI